MTIADSAVALALQTGIPVFAVTADKQPAVKGGFYAATTDELSIRSQFRAPFAVAVGMPTGKPSGLIAIDIDVKPHNDGQPWLAEHQHALPRTRTHRSPSGGTHLIFRAPTNVEIRNSASRIAPGVDVRGDGGYLTIPPSPGYTVQDDAEPATMPSWLVRACLPPPAPEPPVAPSRPASARRLDKWVTAAIDGEVNRLSQAREGTRNDTLNHAAFKLGQLVGGNLIDRPFAEQTLQATAQATGLTPRETALTIQSGLDAGIANPRFVETLPDKPHPGLNGHDHTTLSPPPDETDPNYWRALQADISVDAAAARIADPGHDTHNPHSFPATPLTADELEHIPPRELVYSHFLFRKFISALGAPGGAGKTAYAMAIALAISASQDILGETVHDPGPVWIYNLEDPRTELLRRIKAALDGHNLSFDDIAGNLYLDSGRDRQLIIAHAEPDGTVIASPIVPDLVAEIKDRQIRLLIVDPFVRSHRVAENHNDQIDFVAALWSQVAEHADCAILLVHHFRKGGTSGDAAAFRGASALIDASRAAVTLSTMAEAEAQSFSIPDADRWRFIRIDNAKLNLAPPPEHATWLQLTSVNLDNATDTHQADSVQTVRRHTFNLSSAWERLDTTQCNAALDIIGAGVEPGIPFSPSRRGSSPRWAGQVLIDHFGLTEAEAKIVIDTWLENGVLTTIDFRHPHSRHTAQGVNVNNGRRPGPI